MLINDIFGKHLPAFRKG